jgi:hypothetical protein
MNILSLVIVKCRTTTKQIVDAEMREVSYACRTASENDGEMSQSHSRNQSSVVGIAQTTIEPVAVTVTVMTVMVATTTIKKRLGHSNSSDGVWQW